MTMFRIHDSGADQSRHELVRRIDRIADSGPVPGRDELLDRILRTRARGGAGIPADFLPARAATRRRPSRHRARAASLLLVPLAAAIALVVGLRSHAPHQPNPPVVRDVVIRGPNGEPAAVQPTVDPNVTVILISSEPRK